jgi:hypothetical protein
MSPADTNVDRYLGQIFDRLAGTGSAGRRALVEIEDHLRCAITHDDAEARAIERLGPPDRLTRGLIAQFVVPWRTVVARLIGGVWLLGAIALMCVGLSGVLAAGAGALWGHSAIADDTPATTYSPARCAYLLEYYPQPDGSCRAASIAHHYQEAIHYRLAAGVAGGVALAGWFLVRRSRSRRLAWLTALTRTPPPLVTATLAASISGLAALVLIGQGIDAFALHRPWGAWAILTAGIALTPASVVAAARVLAELRHQPVH